ncbi:MAG: hypothetical protein NXI31_19525 [bacterium]|nr:hypothetical protein [bacterium]
MTRKSRHPKVTLPLTALFVTAFLPAQQHSFAFYPDPDVPVRSTVISIRGAFGNATGELLMRADEIGLRGFGMTARGIEITGSRIFFNDPNGQSAERYAIVARRAAANGLPDPTPNGLLFREVFTTQTGSGGWFADARTFAAPIQLPAALSNGDWFVGIEFVDRATSGPFGSDGLFVFAAFDTAYHRGDNPRSGAPTTLYEVTNSAAGRSTLPGGSIHLELVTTAPTLMAGGRNPANSRQTLNGISIPYNFGRGGRFVDVRSHLGSGRFDDLAVRLSGPTGGLAFLALAPNLATSSLPFAGIQGELFLSPTTMFHAGTFVLPTTGEADLLLALGPASSPVRLIASQTDLHAQVLMFDPVQQTAMFTNAITWNSKP